MRVSIRPYRPDDFAPLALLWRQAREQAFPEFQRAKGHSFEEDQAYFRDVILINDDVWEGENRGVYNRIPDCHGRYRWQTHAYRPSRCVCS